MEHDDVNVSSEKGNKVLHNAQVNKYDEFYTRIEDIENELMHYKEHFKGKIVLCNCDDPFESNFFKYFAMNFNTLGLKKLICTSYDGSPVAYTQLSLFEDGNDIDELDRKAYKIEINEVSDFNKDGATDLSDVEWLLRNEKNSLTILKQHGDFRSEECIEILKTADIVVTNPPFSLWKDFFDLLIKYDKKFLILGNPNAITYKNVFPQIINNKVWLGYKSLGTDTYFLITDEYKKVLLETNKEGSGYKTIDGVIYGRTMACWYTNLEIQKRYEKMFLYKQYNPEEYPKYDNYNAINVNKVSDIPCDYYGVMGVPIPFLGKHCPEQFNLIGCTESEGRGFSNGLWDEGSKVSQATINGKRVYKRLFIQRRK